MTQSSPPLPPSGKPPHFQDGMMDRLAGKGASPDAAKAMLEFDSQAFVFHRMVVKGEVPGKLLAELNLGLDLSQFQSLTAIVRIQQGIGRPKPLAATIGLLADELNLDPSRASRIAGDLIGAGYVQREAAQDDGRKTVLVLTDKAITLFRAFRDLKFDKLMQVFEGWTDAEIVQFSGLFARYCSRIMAVYQSDQ